MKRTKRSKQLSFSDRRTKSGKARKRPGRRPQARSGVPHRSRPTLARWNPVHVTMRAVHGLPSFRDQLLFAAFLRAIARTRRPDFRIAEFSVQRDHLHLIVEADSKDALARGMKSFSVRANRMFNIASGRRRGRVWAQRYHRHDLTTPRQVRNALVYCLNNARKHGELGTTGLRIDGYSSARWFSGWSIDRSVREGPSPLEPARTALLRALWRKHGLIHPLESPVGAPAPRPRSPRTSVWH